MIPIGKEGGETPKEERPQWKERRFKRKNYQVCLSSRGGKKHNGVGKGDISEKDFKKKGENTRRI